MRFATHKKFAVFIAACAACLAISGTARHARATPIDAHSKEVRTMQRSAPKSLRLPVEDAMPAFAPGQWLNSPPLSPASLRGKVVLVQFWTYSCINWLRTMPYVRAWERKYGAQGLVVVGVHAPEFGFERDLDNVRRAVAAMDIAYPVVTDNQLATWRAFDNAAWPALYFVDAKGQIRHHYFGEGAYAESEQILQQLLAEAGHGDSPQALTSVQGKGFEAAADWNSLRTPETYVGYERTESFSSPGGLVPDQRHAYTAPSKLGLNRWALAGDWTVGRQATVANSAHARIAFRFHARDLHLVMGPHEPGRAVHFRVLVDGERPGNSHGIDVDDGGTGTVTEHRLYQLIRQNASIEDHTFEIEFLDAGVETFSFTFG